MASRRKKKLFTAQEYVERMGAWLRRWIEEAARLEALPEDEPAEDATVTIAVMQMCRERYERAKADVLVFMVVDDADT